MTGLVNLTLAFVFSFLGSIPPGTINLTLVQLGLTRKTITAFKFACAATLVEYPYAWLAVKFEKLILGSAEFNDNLHLLASAIMIIIGVIGVLPRKQSSKAIALTESGFRRGLLMGILNPLAIPYWVGITAFLRGENLVKDLDGVELHLYLAGVVLGAFALLTLLILLSQRMVSILSGKTWLTRLPAVIILALGIISLARYVFSSL